MKIACSILLLLALASSLVLGQAVVIIVGKKAAGGANNIVYQSGGSTACAGGSEVTTYNCSNTVTYTTGWTVYVWASGYAGSGTINAPTDGTNTYTAIHATLSDGGNAKGRLFRASNVTGGTYTVQWTSSVGMYPGLSINAYSNVNTSDPNNGSNTGTGSGTAPDAGTISTTNAADLIFTCYTGSAGGTVTHTEPTDFTLRQHYDNGAVSTTFACAEKLETTTGTKGGAFTTSPSTGWVAGVTAEKSN